MVRHLALGPFLLGLDRARLQHLPPHHRRVGVAAAPEPCATALLPTHSTHTLLAAPTSAPTCTLWWGLASWPLSSSASPRSVPAAWGRRLTATHIPLPPTLSTPPPPPPAVLERAAGVQRVGADYQPAVGGVVDRRGGDHHWWGGGGGGVGVCVHAQQCPEPAPRTPPPLNPRPRTHARVQCMAQRPTARTCQSRRHASLSTR